MSASEVPSSWLACLLGDVIDYGRTAKAEPEEIPANAWVLELEDIEKDSSRVLQRITFADRQSKSTKNRFEAGDVLYGKLRPYLNKVVRATESGFCTTEIVPLRPPAEVDGDFLFYWLKHPQFREYVESVSHGLNMPRLGTEAANAAPFVLAPLGEQRRIGEKLNALFERLESCRNRFNRVPGILKRFRQSVLAAATSGELTQEWRNKRYGRTDTKSWSSSKLVDMCIPSRVITYGVIKLGAETPSGVPCLRTSNVRWLRVDTDGMKRISQSLSAEFGRTALQGGEVLVNVRGTLGGVAVADATMRGWNVSREVAVVPVDQTRMNADFLAFWIGSDAPQRWLSKVEKGVAYTGINIEDLRLLPVSVPTIEEQAEIVRRVQSLLTMADELDQRHAAITRAAGLLSPALLAKAFRGDLVRQDPKDEPASELLARIRSAQAPGRESGMQKSTERPRTGAKPVTGRKRIRN